MANFRTYIIVSIAALIVVSSNNAIAGKCDIGPNGGTPAASLIKALKDGWTIKTEDGYKALSGMKNAGSSTFLSRLMPLIFYKEIKDGSIVNISIGTHNALEYKAITDEAKAKIHDLTCN